MVPHYKYRIQSTIAASYRLTHIAYNLPVCHGLGQGLATYGPQAGYGLSCCLQSQVMISYDLDNLVTISFRSRESV